MKKNIKIKKIILIMLIILIAGGTTIWAATQFYAKDITYKDGKTVEIALNELNSQIPYKVTYDANGGSGKMAVGEKYSGQDYTVAECGFTAPTNKYFVEWNTSADGTGTSYKPGDTYSDDKTLYAIWADGYALYKMGDEVSIGEGEQKEYFYVLENSDATQSTVKLITKFNLNQAGTAQEDAAYGETASAFSSINYWSSVLTSTPFNLNNIEGFTATDAIGKARSYAQSKGAIIGRLLTFEEATILKSIADSDTTSPVYKMLWGTENTANGYLKYWLSSASGGYYNVWAVTENKFDYATDFRFAVNHGIRPVLEISKSKIS